ncbi:MAG: TOBE domain-containing protein, partial [Geminicoccales bacterium]
LYLRPANLTDARFMGYRNIVELAVERVDGDRVWLAGAGLRLHGARCGELDGGRAMAAIRPEEVTLDDDGPNPVDGRVDQVEYGGRDFLADIVTPLGTIFLRTPQKVVRDQAVRLSLRPERLLVFPSDGRADALMEPAE